MRSKLNYYRLNLWVLIYSIFFEKFKTAPLFALQILVMVAMKLLSKVWFVVTHTGTIDNLFQPEITPGSRTDSAENQSEKSLLQIDEVELEDGSHQRLVKIRNPWAQTEWEGPWGDGTEEWEMVPDYEKERINYENKDDGGFWMSFQGTAQMSY